MAEGSWFLSSVEEGQYDYALLLETAEAHRVAMGVWPRASLAREDEAERHAIREAFIGTGG